MKLAPNFDYRFDAFTNKDLPPEFRNKLDGHYSSNAKWKKAFTQDDSISDASNNEIDIVVLH